MGGVGDLERLDFRLRVWQRLGRAPGTEKERSRFGQLAKDGRAELAPLDADSLSDRRLGEMTHVTTDKSILKSLLDYSISTNAQPKFWLQKLFQELDSGETRSDCFQLLMNLGVVSPKTNPCVLRHTEPLVFSPQALSEVPKLMELYEKGHDAHKVMREEFTLPVLTIDAATATEIDDGISCENDWIYVHVADPTRLIKPRSLLDSYSSNRGVSVYLPETHFPLFPASLSHAFSINPGRETHTMTFAGRLDEATGRLVEYRIFPSLVSNVLKISYSTSDAVLGGCTPEGVTLPPAHEAALNRLNQWAQVRRRYRESEGALNVNIPEPQVTFRGAEVVVVSAVDSRDSASRSLVEECMILAGQVGAEYARKNELPIPFRVQKGGKGGGGGRGADKLERATDLLSSLRLIETHAPATNEITPSRHYSVGLDAYTQVTSPIRRYADTLVAHQIKAHLLKDPLPFSSWDVLQWVDQYELSLRRVGMLQQNSTRYWTLRYLEKNGIKSLKALVLARASVTSAATPAYHVMRKADGCYETGDVCPVFLIDYAFRGAVKLKQRRVVPGEIIEVFVANVDSVRLQIDLSDV